VPQRGDRDSSLGNNHVEDPDVDGNIIVIGSSGSGMWGHGFD